MIGTVYRHEENRIEKATIAFWDGSQISFTVARSESTLLTADLYTDAKTGYSIIISHYEEVYFSLESDEFRWLRIEFYDEDDGDKKQPVEYHNPRRPA